MAKRCCCLCNNPIDAKSAPILTLGAAGWPRMICDDCDKRIVTASTSKTYDEIEATCRALGDGMVAMRVEDSAVIETVNGIIESSMQRAEQIKNGTYDFSLDEAEEEAADEEESSEEEAAADGTDADGADEDEGEAADEEDAADEGEEFDIPEELRETEEDRALDEAEAKQSKVLDTVVSWVSALIFLGAVIFFIVKFVF